MFGAIIGDIVGSVYEFNPTKEKDFVWMSEESHVTDDTIMTVAVAETLLQVGEDYIDCTDESIISRIASRSFRTDVCRRFESYGWDTQLVANGNDVDEEDDSYGNSIYKEYYGLKDVHGIDRADWTEY